MRCPQCRQAAHAERIRYFELNAAGELVPLNTALMSCGCEVSLDRLDLAAADWQTSAGKRRDDNLRSVFA